MTYQEAIMPVEHFDEVPVSVLEVMESDKQAHLAQALFERLVETKDYVNAKKMVWFMQKNFNIQLSN